MFFNGKSLDGKAQGKDRPLIGGMTDETAVTVCWEELNWILQYCMLLWDGTLKECIFGKGSSAMQNWIESLRKTGETFWKVVAL